MRDLIRRLRWPDYLILAILALFFGYVWFTIEASLNYNWRWDRIPNQIVGYHTVREEYFVGLLLRGMIATIRICIYAAILAVILGTILGIARCSTNLTIRMLARTYMECLRNIPPVVVIFIFFFFFSQQLVDALDLARWSRNIARNEVASPLWEFFFGDMRRFPAIISGVIVLALFQSAFVGEIVRAGIESIPRGQREAAKSIGMSRYAEMRYIVLPQAYKKVVPPLTNQFITLIKDSSIVSLISIPELTYNTLELVASSRMIFEAWLTTAAFYFILCFGLSRVFAQLERRREGQQ